MDEEQARLALKRILNILKENIMFTEMKFTDGTGFVEYHIRWIKSHSKNNWDNEVAKARLGEIAFNTGISMSDVA